MNNELYHYGVLGMKWGVRRYQNADGSLTAAGKKRYSSSSREDTPHYNINARDVKRNSDKMTDAELQRAINRLNMQQQLDRMNPSVIERGRNVAKQIVKDVGLITGLYAIGKKVRRAVM